jgi:hypothetical protein
MSKIVKFKSKTEPKGYKMHKLGSRKGDTHQLFDKNGPDAAFKLGVELGLAEGTLRSWFGAWSKGKGKSAPKKAPAKEKATESVTQEQASS